MIPINAPMIGRAEISAAASVLRDGALTSAAACGGDRVREFEGRVASFVKSRYAVAVSSGTAALQASLYALDVGRDDEVLIPSFTFVATANAVASTGARPVFVDVLRDNYTMDPDDLQKKVTDRTRAIIPVHLYGGAARVEEISEVARRHGLPVIEDAAQSLGTTYKGRHTGTFFEMGCCSMYPAKVMTSGEGGFVVTSSRRLRDRLLMIRNHGMVRGHDTRVLGLNLRLAEVNAAIASVQIKRLPGFLRARRRNAALLSELISDLGGDMAIPRPRRGEEPNWYLYTVATGGRDGLLRRLHAGGIGAAAYYPVPAHRTPLYRKGGAVRLPVTDWAASRVVSLPVHPGVTRGDIASIAGMLHRDAGR